MPPLAIRRRCVVNACTALLVLGTAQSFAPAQPADSPAARRGRFHFATETAADGFVPVSPEARYTPERGYGFEGSGENPRFFSVEVPEGRYRVTVTIGDRRRAASITLRAELRRLMVEDVRTAAGEFKRSTFVVDVRRPQIAGGGEVRLKDRERTSEWRAWDDRLTFEFGGSRPAVEKLEIVQIDDLPTLFLIGDSTVCDQPSEPYASWGQMLPRFFQPSIVVANHAESGESYRSSLAQRRFDKIFSQMRPGDYLLMQFGHNDMKSVDEADYAGSIADIVAACRARGGRPVVISPMERCGFDSGGKVRESLRGFPVAARDAARDLGVPFIDLHAMSKALYEALGPQRALLAFAAPEGRQDLTHHNNYGSYQLAKCVVEGIRDQVPELARHVLDDLPRFDPFRPDNVETFTLPPSGTYVAAHEGD